MGRRSYRPSILRLRVLNKVLVMSVLREAWERDVRERKEFFEDQLKNSKLTNIVTS